MKEKIKKYIGEILLLTGVFIVIYNILNFGNSNRGCIIFGGCNHPVWYFYSDEVRFMVGFGVMLLIVGILVVKNKK